MSLNCFLFVSGKVMHCGSPLFWAFLMCASLSAQSDQKQKQYRLSWQIGKNCKMPTLILISPYKPVLKLQHKRQQPGSSFFSSTALTWGSEWVSEQAALLKDHLSWLCFPALGDTGAPWRRAKEGCLSKLRRVSVVVRSLSDHRLPTGSSSTDCLPCPHCLLLLPLFTCLPLPIICLRTSILQCQCPAHHVCVFASTS